MGLHRFSLAQLAARIAASPLVLRGVGPSSTLGTEAVAARATFETSKADALDYFTPVVGTPGFPRALASTLRELREAFLGAERVRRAPRVGGDLAALLDNFEAQFASAAAADRAELFRVATEEVRRGRSAWSGRPLLLLDVASDSPAEREFISALVAAAPASLMTIPAGDELSLRAAGNLTVVEHLDDESGESDLTHLRRHLFAETQPKERSVAGEVRWFSAPGEGRECVEIARFILAEARAGVPFDEMAILLRAPQRYQGQLEHALARAGVPAWFDRGTRRPHPAGRAFLAVLACATENLSASRFAEYLSLAQVPRLDVSSRRTAPGAPSTAPDDEVLAAFTRRADDGEEENSSADEGWDPGDAESSSTDAAVIAGSLRAPWKWERLLVESAVIGGADRWRRRLEGLDREYQLNAAQLQGKDPDDPRLDRIVRDRENLRRLREFALPLIETLASWPAAANWGDWLQLFDGLAPRVLRRPEEVRGVLADLRPMSAIGPVPLDEVVHVLSERLLAIESPAPRHRYGRVFVGSPHQARARTFRVVFVPGLAERMFPQRLREDPLLVDEVRRGLHAGLAVETDRATTERLLLRLASGAATERLYVSYPRVDSAEARERVPSFYGLEVMRAVTGEVMGPDRLRQLAAAATDASLAWPAPGTPDAALDDFEHDLAVLAPLLKTDDINSLVGRARYLVQLSDTLRRSVTSRWERWQHAWGRSDGIIRASKDVKEALASQRLTARPYSLSALQNFAECPYRFLLSAIHRLEPFEIPLPLQRLDALTKGSLVHRVQAEWFRTLQADGNLPLAPERLGRALNVMTATIDRVAAQFEDELAPAIDRVWRDEIESIRSDLLEWVRRLVETADDFDPEFFEFAFGLGAAGDVGHDRRDPQSRAEPVTVGGRFVLRGSVDLVERKRGTRQRRITDHKTGRNRSEPGTVVGGGRVLQPLLYGLAVELALGDPVLAGRLSYCTSAGDFSTHDVPLSEANRRSALEVLEIIDRAIETGFLVAAPGEGACNWCDFHVVCGPAEERRVAKKHPGRLADLIALREKP
ncbi:MAG TPA: PD-(D/E)XK nuclease family protein [Vicinamibacterales bacterium]|nr:PD-(D/E)XK nuclease family protein [Vicinamibacterales bacterium]